jgi:hypothetical protein
MSFVEIAAIFNSAAAAFAALIYLTSEFEIYKSAFAALIKFCGFFEAFCAGNLGEKLQSLR